MNNIEQLEYHQRTYSWLKEQLKKHRWLSEDDRTDWVILEGDYPELLTFMEDLISSVECLVSREQELLAKIDDWKEEVNHLNWLVGEKYEKEAEFDLEEMGDDDDDNCWVEYPTVEE